MSNLNPIVLLVLFFFWRFGHKHLDGLGALKAQFFNDDFCMPWVGFELDPKWRPSDDFVEHIDFLDTILIRPKDLYRDAVLFFKMFSLCS